MSVLESLRWMFPAHDGDVWGEKSPKPIKMRSRAGSETDELEITCEPFRGIPEPEEIQRVLGFRSSSREIAEEGSGLLLRAHGC